MNKETKKERFERIAEARKEKILDTVRLLENCSNKSNYDYSSDEIEMIFDELTTALENAKAKFTSDSKQKRMNAFKRAFEAEYTWLEGFMRNVRRYGNHEALFDPANNKRWSYAELNAEANKLANTFLEKGAKKGTVVMFRL